MANSPKLTQAASLETKLHSLTLLSQRLGFKYESHLKTLLQIKQRERGKGRKKI